MNLIWSTSEWPNNVECKYSNAKLKNQMANFVRIHHSLISMRDFYRFFGFHPKKGHVSVAQTEFSYRILF